MAKEEESVRDGQDGSLKGRILQWAILGVVVLGCAASGTILGRLLGGSPPAPVQPPDVNTQQVKMQNPTQENPKGDAENNIWYYKLDPVVANLNEPKVTRYARLGLTLAVSKTMTEKDGTTFFEAKKPYITNWLTIYLASQSVDDIRGDRNLKRIQSELVLLLNEKLFPESEQYIKRVLLQEFAVQ